MAVARAELLVPAQTAAHSCQESTVAVHPVTHPRVRPVMPQEDARLGLLTESPPKRYPVQAPAQQLLNTPMVQSLQKSCSHDRYLPHAFVSSGPDPWRPPVPHCPASGPWGHAPSQCQLTARELARCHRCPHLPAAPGSHPTPQTAFSSGALWQMAERRKDPRGFSSESGRQRCVGRARGESKRGMSQGRINQGREQTQLWSVQPQLGPLLPPMDANHQSPTLATQQRTHFREPVAHLMAASSLPSRGLVNPGNSWAEAEEASFISISAVDSMLGA